MITTYVVLDSNIIFRFATQGLPGCELEHWNHLTEAIRAKSAVLLVPEVILIECQRKSNSLKAVMNTKIEAVIKRVKSESERGDGQAIIWSEIRDLPEALFEFLTGWKETRIKNAVDRFSQAIEFLKSDDVTYIPFTQEIVFRSTRRTLSTGLARSQDADSFIVDSLAMYFSDKMENSQLLFCSENFKDFGVESNNQWVLHPRMSEGLPPSVLFKDLKSLVPVVADHSTIILPTKSDIEEAAMRQTLTDQSMFTFEETVEAQKAIWRSHQSWIDEGRSLLRTASIRLEPMLNSLNELGFTDEKGRPMPSRIIEGDGCVVWDQWTYPNLLVREDQNTMLWFGGAGTITQFMGTEGSILLICGIRLRVSFEGLVLMTAATVCVNGDCSELEVQWVGNRSVSIGLGMAQATIDDLLARMLSEFPSAFKRYKERIQLLVTSHSQKTD